MGLAFVIDESYNDVGEGVMIGSQGSSGGTYTTPYTAKVSYTTSFPGMQEGIVAVGTIEGGLDEAATVVMVKVLIRG